MRKQETVPMQTFGEVVVRYSHYKDKFSIKNGVLLEKDVDEQYCLSFVFKGEYKLILKSNDKNAIMKNIPGGWEGL